MRRSLAVLVSVWVLPGHVIAYRDAPALPDPDYSPSGPIESPSSRARRVAANLEGFELALGLGVSGPLGDFMKNGSMDSLVAAGMPLFVGVGYRVSPVFSLGVVGQYAPMSTKNCDPGSSCSASDDRVGGEMRFHAEASQALSPWLSLGMGYEWLKLSEKGGAVWDVKLKGLDFDLGLGMDLRASQTFTIGPLLDFRYGKFGSASGSMRGTGSYSGDIPGSDQSAHEWLTFGVRGAFTL